MHPVVRVRQLLFARRPLQVTSCESVTCLTNQKQVASHTGTSELTSGMFAIVREMLNLSLRAWDEASQGRFMASARKHPISYNLSLHYLSTFQPNLYENKSFIRK